MKSLFHSASFSLGLAAVAMLGFTGCGSESETEATAVERPTTLKFADTGIDGMEEMRRAFGEFVAVMEETTGMKVEFFPVADRTIAAAALEAGDVDIVLAGPTEYLFIKSRNDVQPLAGIERAEYTAVIIVPIDSPAQSLADLKGKKIAFKDAGSTSGHVVPVRMLLDAGLEEGRDYEGPLVDKLRFEMIYAGDCDAITGGIKDFRKVEEDRPGEFRILAESDTLPRDLFVIRQGIDPELVDELRTKILENSDKIMAAILAPGERGKYDGAKIVPVKDSDYDSMRETHKLLDLPFDE